ncbi:MAG: mannose-1-phosphate guanylyltransferase/mannose-6-phosphate isomerase [Hyphomicrobiaceae bacterium]|nr:mannose-1-phosphate guanylyltransferase/mannose-6-phosphate isomerase [Hyphomicrobiaceae bacterium]MCC0009561.1 mannose-1-phosphate guanylyltransferase/mannose-6-phosphate isomerase [Hyphomicrobiaceae bacterium]
MSGSSRIFPVILSGGSGTRLWPLSRAMYPKQFLRFFDGSNPSLLDATLKRLSPDKGFAAPIIMCNNDHRFLVREEMDRAGFDAKAIILEPVARNTAPAIAVAALAALSEHQDAIIVVMPSDHVVQDDAKFVETVSAATRIAQTGRLVLFGITPSSPHTGYGYIKQGEVLDGFAGRAYSVGGFTEKPDRATAESYLSTREYVWNSGIFVLHAQTFIDELQHLAPKVLESAKSAYAKRTEDIGFERLAAEPFASSPSISIDYAVMEKTSRAVVLPIDVGWNDIGSWSSLWEIAPHDQQGNYTHGDAILKDTENCYVHSERHLVTTLGVDNLVIVDTADALLVANRSRAQDVSKIVQHLKRSNRKEHEQNIRSVRPWGYFETLSLEPRFQVKLLHVKPGGKLSMQMHHHRSEHWIVVKGTALVTIGEEERLVRENESVYIFATQWHRLENPGKLPLEIIEVQIGSYLGEDDIIRTHDLYNRTPEETK